MGNAISCGKNLGDFKAPQFENKNNYLCKKPHSDADIKEIANQIAPGQDLSKVENIAQYINQSPNLIFKDTNFEILDPKNSQKKKLSHLYDYKRQNIQNTYNFRESPPELISQKEVELCYSTSVLYLLSLHQNLKEQIIWTKHVNRHHAYLIRLFCNGAECVVAVDDEVPVHGNKIVYLNVANGKELWPILVEKAWTKQVGSYDKARGLSPEDSFEEITGIPTNSLRIKDYHIDQVKTIISESLKSRFWIVLTGFIIEKQIKSRQVFYVQGLEDNGNSLLLRSPFHDFSIQGSQSNKKGFCKIGIGKAFSLFEFATFGYYYPNYEPVSLLKISSKYGEEVIVEVEVKKREKINIRFNQFYKEYFSEEQKQFYEYSPLCMELYNQRGSLIKDCEGIPEVLEGIRSSHLAKSYFVELESGKYYLRMQINWVNEQSLNSGNLVAYCSPGNVTMKRAEKQNVKLSQWLIQKSLEADGAEKIVKEDQEIIVRWLEKQYRYLLGIQNYSKQGAQLRIKFKESENIRINHFNMDKQSSIEFKLKAEEMTILQVVPADPHKPFLLAPFDIIKF